MATADERRRHCWCVVVDVVIAALWATKEGRDQQHRVTGSTRRCDVRLVVAGVDVLRGGVVVLRPTPAPVACPHCGQATDYVLPHQLSREATYFMGGDCPCGGYVAEALGTGLDFVERGGSGIVNPAGAARVHVGKRQHEHGRRFRTSRGALARPERLAEGRYGRAMATETQRALLVDLAWEAGSAAPLDSAAQLFGRLAFLRAQRTGEDAEQIASAVWVDYDEVRRVCTTGPKVNIGTRAHPEYVTWWDAYIERPLGLRRPRRQLSLDAEQGVAACLNGDDIADAATNAVLDVIAKFIERTPQTAPSDLLERALAELVRSGVLSRRTMRDMLRDPQRYATAVAATTAIKSFHLAVA